MLLITSAFELLQQCLSSDPNPRRGLVEDGLQCPFGVLRIPCNVLWTQAVFQALVNDVLRDTLNCIVFVYLDNILIFTCEEHVHHSPSSSTYWRIPFMSRLKSVNIMHPLSPVVMGSLQMDPTKVPFLIWTDYKNLENIHSDRRLNSHQAHWAIFHKTNST